MIVLILTVARGAAVGGELRLQRHALDGVQLQISAAEEAAALDVTLVGAIVVEQRRTVGGIPGVRCRVDAAVVEVGVGDGGHLLCLVEYAAGHLVVALVSIREAGTYLYDLIYLVVDVHTTCVAVVLIALQQTFVVHGSQRDVEVRLLVTTLD